MVIQIYDLTLVRLKHQHIEEVRLWRNSEKIRANMEYRDYISPIMQEEWFKRINDIRKYIFLMVQVEGKFVGMLSAKDFAINKAEGGMFFWDDNYLNSHLPVIASLFFSDLNFYFMSNTQAYCKILRSNTQAIAYNKGWGYKLCNGQEGLENQLYRVSREDYEKCAAAIRVNLQRLFPEQGSTVIIRFENEDYTNGVVNTMSRYYESYAKETSPVHFKLVYP